MFDEKHYIHVRRTVHAFHTGLERIFGDFDARHGNPPTNLMFHMDITTP